MEITAEWDESFVGQAVLVLEWAVLGSLTGGGRAVPQFILEDEDDDEDEYECGARVRLRPRSVLKIVFARYIEVRRGGS